jgi:hypothetical protein
MVTVDCVVEATRTRLGLLGAVVSFRTAAAWRIRAGACCVLGVTA